jgi:hypothetical protein
MPDDRRAHWLSAEIKPLLCLLSGLCAALALTACSGSSGSGGSSSPDPDQQITSTTTKYVEEFYPLWFTYYQSQYTNQNQLAGPNEITPAYQIVVAINDDTLYVSSFLDIAPQPVVVTIPATSVVYSILTLDPYGNIIQTGIPALTPGVYGLTGPGFTGALPGGVTQVKIPLSFCLIIFRVDTHSGTGEDQTSQAQSFRGALRLQTLSDYQSDPTGGPPRIVPVELTSLPFKTAADTLIALTPITFLQQLQVAIASSNTPALTADQQTLVNDFNKLFGDGNSLTSAQQLDFMKGAQAAHDALVKNYLTHTGSTNWISFTDIGNWGTNYLNRASITEYLQFGNARSTAAYFHAFEDGTGTELNGANGNYVLTFPANNIPQASRFWSLTAYTPQTVELVPNSADKYVVASYTSGLTTNADGSISIYMAQTQPSGVPAANWLPIPNGQFNIMLRVYGPQGSVANNTFLPPAITKM